MNVEKRMRSAMAPVFLAAVLESICASVVDEACDVASGIGKSSTIAPRHVLLALKNKTSLAKLTKNGIFECGILPNQVRAKVA